MVDGDDTYSPEHAVEMCDMVIEGKMDMVVGDRLSSTYYKENTPAIPWAWKCIGAEKYQYNLSKLAYGHHDRLPGFQPQVCQNLPGDQPWIRDRDRDDDPRIG